VHKACAGSEDYKFDLLSSDEQEIVEKMKKNSWLFDEKKEKEEPFEKTVIEGKNGELMSVKEFLKSDEYLKRKK